MDKAQIRKALSESVPKAENLEDFLVIKLTGLTPDQIRKLKERDTKKIIYADNITRIGKFGNCPTCGRRLRDLDCTTFCGSCGQRLNWEGKENETD